MLARTNSRSARWLPRIASFGAALGAFVALGACDAAPIPTAAPAPTPTGAAPSAADDLISEAAFRGQLDRTHGTKDCFSVIRDPVFLPADGLGGAHGVTDKEFVIGLDLGEVSVCYPVLYLDYHEIVEHRMAGLELLACW